MNFLNGCEMSASVAQCSCLLGFFEANVPLARFGQDDALAAQGQVTADLRDAENACPSSLSQSVGV